MTELTTGASRYLTPAARWVADELLGGRPRGTAPELTITAVAADDTADPLVHGYRALRREVFCREQGLFADSGAADLDDHDADDRALVLVAHDPGGALLGGVRLGPARPDEPDVGWWAGSRLVVAPGARGGGTAPGARGGGTAPGARGGGTAPGARRGGAHVGAALVRAACARAEAAGALRFDADVQAANAVLFDRLGWTRVRETVVAGVPHVRMRWPIGRIAALATATKAPLGPLLGALGPPGFVGDDGAPVPGTDMVACCDAIVPAMVERDPEWAGWAGVLVNVNDLAAMGAAPVGLLDAIGARDASFAHRVLSGVRAAADAWGVPLLGGHTQLDVPAALSLTALGRTAHPVPAAGGRSGHRVRLTTDLGGGWRPGYGGRQWDSTTSRSRTELAAMTGAIGPAAAHRPAAAKDVSMAGLAGTLGMLAEASGVGAVLDVAAVPRPDGVSTGDWLTCFPGFGLLTADDAGAPAPQAGPAVSAEVGELRPGGGVRLRWPDGEETDAVPAGVTGMGTGTAGGTR
ncbi:MSMEG_0567/sll0787 family protein [Pseudonocardia phyllosphaerae]|uniref:MSMEG_0567/sll0787 family protein n=1 Tax=Pseudonocardia phyllosphaerae TaxID=3390502 RepID=UPI00397CD7B9